MTYFQYLHHNLYAEKVSLTEIAEKVGTPCYIYSRAAIETTWQSFDQAFASIPHLICYSVKANSNLAVLNVLARLGSGFDIVSQGELERVLKAGGDPSKVVFAGIGKSTAEIERALQVGIHTFDVESISELERLNSIAEKLHLRAPICLRINPDVNAKTHPYISTGLKENKFGIPSNEVLATYRLAKNMRQLDIVGIACHIGSQLLELAPFIDALEKVLVLIEQLHHDGIKLKYLNFGGGLGVRYHDETPLNIQLYADAIIKKIHGQNLKLIIEPGRSIVANAGILLTKIEYLKTTTDKNFAIVDAGMNDLIRPALYEAWHTIMPVKEHPHLTPKTYDVVGPVCETADFIGKNRKLAIEPNDLLAIQSAGAYGFVMSSNYNSRPRVPEVMVDGDKFQIVRERETYEDLMKGERIL